MIRPKTWEDGFVPHCSDGPTPMETLMYIFDYGHQKCILAQK